MPIDIDIEIEPSSDPDQPSRHEQQEREELQALAETIAKLLDSAFVLPGSSIRIGLDPLLGLIPGIGDAITNFIGSVILILATRLGVPRIVIFRMALNIFINMVLGVIPGIGDLFSFWFKSNLRNSYLLRRYCQPTPPVSTTVDWLYVIGLILGMIALIIAVIGIIFWLLGQIWQTLT